MAEKKTFQKPELKVVQLKPAGMVCGSCPTQCISDCGSECDYD